MTFLLTLLTFYLEAKPSAPAPAAAETVTADSEFADVSSVSESFGLPRLTPVSWHASPSLMVAQPPALAISRDVFASAGRPPQEFPGLLPCEPVALVPCPAPEPVAAVRHSEGIRINIPALGPATSDEAPAVRHVSFADGVKDFSFHVGIANPAEGFAEARLHGPVKERYTSARESGYEDACPVGECKPGCVGSPLVGKPLCEQLHARHHAPSHPFPPFPHPLPFGPVPFGHPVAFAPMAEGMCPTGMTCPVMAEGSPFPGAKNVEHVVRATYEVPRGTAKALEPILEQSNGVLGCTVDGDELTINATAPTQMAIAQFLAAVVQQPRTISHPAKAIDVKFTKPSCCDGPCGCKAGECQCCCCKKDKTTAAASSKKHFISEKAKAIQQALGLNCQANCPSAAACETKCQQATQCSATTTCAPAGRCDAACDTQAVVKWKTRQPKPLQVEIVATPEGVMLKTSDGAQLRATRIRLETNGLNKLQVENGNVVFTMPKPHTPPVKAVTKPLPTY